MFFYECTWMIAVHLFSDDVDCMSYSVRRLFLILLLYNIYQNYSNSNNQRNNYHHYCHTFYQQNYTSPSHWNRKLPHHHSWMMMTSKSKSNPMMMMMDTLDLSPWELGHCTWKIWGYSRLKVQQVWMLHLQTILYLAHPMCHILHIPNVQLCWEYLTNHRGQWVS